MKGVGRKCGQKGGEQSAQAIALVRVVLGARKGWVHESLRPLSLVLSGSLSTPAHRFLSHWAPQLSWQPRIPRSTGCRTEAPVNHHVPHYPLCLHPPLPLGVRFRQRLWRPPGAAEMAASRPPTWIVAVKIPGAFKQYRKSPKGEKMVCQHKKPTLKMWTWIPYYQCEKRSSWQECFSILHCNTDPFLMKKR